MPRKKDPLSENIRGRCTADLKRRVEEYCLRNEERDESYVVRVAVKEFLDREDAIAVKESKAIISRASKGRGGA